jgi:hypothetical protein
MDSNYTSGGERMTLNCGVEDTNIICQLANCGESFSWHGVQNPRVQVLQDIL